MKKQCAILLIVLGLQFAGFCQLETTWWYFGDKAGLDFHRGFPLLTPHLLALQAVVWPPCLIQLVIYFTIKGMIPFGMVNTSLCPTALG